MLGKVIRDCVIYGAAVVGLLFAFTNRMAIYEMIGVTPPKAPVQEAEVKLKPGSPAEQISSGTVAIRKAADGQFWTEARVNGGHVRFLVDTGASVVALTEQDARKAGIRMQELDFSSPVNTANGQTHAAYVELKSVSVGSVTIRNVRAVVLKDGLSTSLLGMSYLGELQKVEATPQSLILRL